MISNYNIFILAISGVSLFLYGLRSFSDEIKNNNSLRIRERLARLSQNRITGFLSGAVLTAVIQSSSAVSSMAITLVDAGIISMQQSFAVLLGCNLGSTATAWIVAMDLSNIGPYFIIFGTFLSAMPIKAHLHGKAIFYFGFILFSISLMSDYLATMDRSDWELNESMLLVNFWWAVLAGIVFTILLQSNSFVAGILIVLAMHQFVGLHSAIGIIMGSNLGASTSAIYSSFRFSSDAKKGAYANLIFRVTGFLLFLPFLSMFETWMQQLNDRLYMQVAIFHTIYQLTLGFIFLPFTGIIAKWLKKEVPISDGKTPD